MAASDTTATGSTTLLMNMRLEIRTMDRHSRAIRIMTSTASSTWEFTRRMEVTKRMMPTTRPLASKGWDTAMICSPVSGSMPVKWPILFSASAWRISPVSGVVPAVRPEEETSMRPLPEMNCSSM